MGKSRKSDAMDESTTEVTSEVTGDATEDAKKAPPEVPAVDKEEYSRLCEKVNAIAQPMADRSLAKKIYKLVRKACTTDKKKYGRGVADVQRMLRKNIKGIVILAGSVAFKCAHTCGAGNVHPVDVYAHIAAICESQGVAYCYTPSREHLGLAAGQRRSSILCLVQRLDAYAKLYDEVHTAIMAMPPPTPVALPAA